MDQAASAFGGITKIDFAGGDRPDVTRIAFDFRTHGYVLCAVNTHSRHDDLTPDYAAIPLQIEDESRNKALADSLDYWYVPCCFVGGKKLHEGVPSREAMRAVLDAWFE